MRTTLAVVELTAREVGQLLAEERFDSLKPFQCKQCGNDAVFARRIFRIIGVPRSEQSRDGTQGLLSLHFKQSHSIDFVFFKSHRRKFFVDSAVCGNCKSTAVIYDITFDDESISLLAKLVGTSEAELKDELEKTYNKLSKDRGKL